MNAISQKQFDRILYLAISRTYLSAIIEATPGKGTVAGEWEMRVDKDAVVIFNEEFGDIVLYLEKGTKPHIIEAKNKKSLRFFDGNTPVFAKKVHHPGIVARLFIQKVLNDTSLKKEFETEFESLLVKEIKI